VAWYPVVNPLCHRVPCGRPRARRLPRQQAVHARACCLAVTGVRAQGSTALHLIGAPTVRCGPGRRYPPEPLRATPWWTCPARGRGVALGAKPGASARKHHLRHHPHAGCLSAQASSVRPVTVKAPPVRRTYSVAAPPALGHPLHRRRSYVKDRLGFLSATRSAPQPEPKYGPSPSEVRDAYGWLSTTAAGLAD